MERAEESGEEMGDGVGTANKEKLALTPKMTVGWENKVKFLDREWDLLFTDDE